MVTELMLSKKVQSRDLKSGRLLGKGSSSIVYETTWKGESYARKDFLRVPSDIFEREAAVLVDLDHPNVVRTYCWTIDEGSCSLVLELMDDNLLNMIQKRKDLQRKNCPGSGLSDASQTSHLIDLHKFIEDGKNARVGTASESVASPVIYPFNMPEALEIIVQIAEGMNFLHSNGVVHGDLKPKNILVTPRGRVVPSSLDQIVAFEVKVADFGLSWTKVKSRTLVSREARNLDMLQWRAPELLDLNFLRKDEDESSADSDWDSDSSDRKIGVHVYEFTYCSDVYNFAFTCWQILTGEEPYSGMGLNDLVREISLGLRPELPASCSAQLSDLIERCWGVNTERPTFYGILSELKVMQASLVADSAVDIKKKAIAGLPLERTASPQFNYECFAVSSESSGNAGGSSDLLPGSETDQEVGIPRGHEERSVKAILDSLQDIEKNITGPPLERTLSQQFVSEHVATSAHSSAISEFSSIFLPGSEIDQEVDVPAGHEIQDSSKGTFILKQRRRGRKAFSCLGGLGCIPIKAMSTKKNEDILTIETPTERSSWLQRRAQDERRKDPPAAWEMTEDREAPKLKEVPCFSFEDIMRMTNYLNVSNLIGQGSNGKVYKGILAGTGATVVVKFKSEEGSEQRERAFKNVIELLFPVHHNNLVGLVGYCFEKTEWMLVYEYLPNGSLEDWLHGSRPDSFLDWDRRLWIALGAARGLAYLHDNTHPLIIHRNVKPSNILLDKRLNAKVADFEVALSLADKKFGYFEHAVEGTFGYVDPEYCRTSVPSTSSDVYSFGVVLLELLTGRPPIVDGEYIVSVVRFTFESLGMAGVMKLLDPAIADTREEDLEMFLMIALVCVEDEALERPSMHAVVMQLEALVGLKSQLMHGKESSIESKITMKGKTVPGEISNATAVEIELSRESSGSLSPSMWPSSLSVRQG